MLCWLGREFATVLGKGWDTISYSCGLAKEDREDRDYGKETIMPTAAKVIIIVTFVLIYMGVFIYIGSNLVRGEEYYNLAPLTTDPHVEHNEGLQPPYWQEPPGPNILPLECGIERPTPIEDYLGSKPYGNGLDGHSYDSNGDGNQDVMISIPTNDVNRYPLFYFFDRDYDGDPDIGYVDTVRDGKCYSGTEGNIRVYWTPQIERKRAEDKYRESDCVGGNCDTRQEGELWPNNVHGCWKTISVKAAVGEFSDVLRATE
jgi:hypothetical protein